MFTTCLCSVVKGLALYTARAEGPRFKNEVRLKVLYKACVKNATLWVDILQDLHAKTCFMGKMAASWGQDGKPMSITRTSEETYLVLGPANTGAVRHILRLPAQASKLGKAWFSRFLLGRCAPAIIGTLLCPPS